MGDPKDKSWLDKAEDYTSDSYDQQRKAIPEWDTFGRAKHDLEVGVMKGVYTGAKGLISGVIDLVILGYKLRNDPETQKKANDAVIWAAKETYTAYFGSPQEVQDQNKRIIAWGDKVYEGIKKSVTDQWEEAGKTEGKQTELATKWVSRGVFEVALFFVGAGEVKAAVEGSSVASKLAKTGRVLDAAEVGCKTVVMSQKEILAEQAARDAAAALKAAEEAKAAKDAAAAAEAARAAAGAAEARKAADAAKVARQRLVDRAGPPQDPWRIRPGEGVLPKTAKSAGPGKPMVLDPSVSERYMYVVKENGDIVYAPQKMKGNLETVKHTDLAQNGPGRVSGELNYDPNTGKWVMDSNSGRYSAAEAIPGNPNSPIFSTRTSENLEAAAELARQSGTSAEIVVKK